MRRDEKRPEVGKLRERAQNTINNSLSRYYKRHRRPNSGGGVEISGKITAGVDKRESTEASDGT